jgi:L-seryl-tRNA(Ser) seleniumtransferase
LISQSSEELRGRCERFVEGLSVVRAEIIEGNSVIGGGSTPAQPLASWIIAIDCPDVVEAERRCRLGDPPVVARIEDERLLVDLRTVFESEEDDLAAAIKAATTA